MENTNYVIMQGWMINELNIKGSELVVYATIYSFSINEHWFKGSMSYLAEWCGTTRQGASNIVKKLVEKNLLEKNERYENGVKFCDYRVIVPNLQGVKNFDRGVSKNLTGGCQKTLHHNNREINIIDNRKENNIKEKTMRFLVPSVEEIREYIEENSYNVDAEMFYDFYESKGWMVGKSKMKDWKSAVRTWNRNNSRNNNQCSEGDRFQRYHTGDIEYNSVEVEL